MDLAGLCRSSLASPSRCCRRPLRFFTGWFLLATVVSSWKNLAWLFSWRLWLGAGYFPCLVIRTVVPVVPFPPFLGHSPLHRWWWPSLFRKRWDWEKFRFFYFCSPGLSLRVLAFAVWVRFPPGWNGGFHLWRFPGESLGWGRPFFDRLILPGSRALGARLPGIPGSWSLEQLPLSRSGCVQLPLPLLVITPFAILVFPRENFGFKGVDGVFGSWFWAGDHLWVFLPARYRSSAPSPSNQVG